MGGTQIQPYATAITKKKEGQSAIYRNPDFVERMLYSPDPELTTMKKILAKKFPSYGEIECLGWIKRKQDQSHIDYLTYNQVWKAAINIGSGIIQETLYFQNKGEKMKFIGIFCKNRPEWTIVDIGCLLYNIVSIPLYDTLGDENISYVLNHTNLTTCFVNQTSLNSLKKTKDFGNLKKLVCFDDFTFEQKKQFGLRGVILLSYKDLLKIGEDKHVDYNLPMYDSGPHDCITFSYTSGTTGPPKGAMLSNQNFTSVLAAIDHSDAKIGSSDTTLSYLPLPHILERSVVYGSLYFGTKIIFYCGDVLKLKDDLAISKPTVMVSVPRIYNRFYDGINNKFQQQTGVKKCLINWGLSSKEQKAEKEGIYSHSFFDSLVFDKVKETVGGNMKLMLTTSAPLRGEVQKFLKIAMSAPMLQAYGQTESSGCIFLTKSKDSVSGHLGGPLASCEYKLVDIPEMEYTSDDKDAEGRPRPRGEIWVRGPNVFLGYYRDDEKTKEAITEDGWLKTGDVGALQPHNAYRLKIIDRKKNIFKLSQGEYVAPEKVENIYSRSPLITEIFHHGTSTEPFAIVFVTPQKENLEKFAAQKGINQSYHELCSNTTVRTAVLSELNKLGLEYGLKSFEQAKNIHLEPEGFAPKGIITNTMKVQRFKARQAFKAQIETLYKEGMLKLAK